MKESRIQNEPLACGETRYSLLRSDLSLLHFRTSREPTADQTPATPTRIAIGAALSDREFSFPAQATDQK